jgi:plastocyanin
MRTTRRILRELLCGVFVAVLILAVIPAKARAAPAVVIVTMTDNPTLFVPEKVTIKVGDTVEWRNTGEIVHWVSIAPPIPPGAQPFDSGPMTPGVVFRQTFTVPGHYRYACVPHAGTGMVGEIEVTK